MIVAVAIIITGGSPSGHNMPVANGDRRHSCTSRLEAQAAGKLIATMKLIIKLRSVNNG